jgi:hypothetical protein
MAFGIAMFLRDTSLKFQQESLDRAKAALGNVSKNDYYTPSTFNSTTKNPYSMDVNGEKENITWLL